MTRSRRWAGCALAMLAAAGCRTASVHRPDVRLGLAAEPTVVRPGEAVRLRFTAANPAGDSVVLEFQEDCRVTLVVLDATERAVSGPSPADPCLQTGAGRVAIPAGGTWQAVGEWRASAEDGTPLPAGTYVLRGVLGEHQSLLRGRRGYKMSHAADTVLIRVQPSATP